MSTSQSPTNVALPLELWPEVSSLPDSVLEDLRDDAIKLLSEGVSGHALASVLEASGWSPAFSRWYASTLSAVASPVRLLRPMAIRKRMLWSSLSWAFVAILLYVPVIALSRQLSLPPVVLVVAYLASRVAIIVSAIAAGRRNGYYFLSIYPVLFCCGLEVAILVLLSRPAGGTPVLEFPIPSEPSLDSPVASPPATVPPAPGFDLGPPPSASPPDVGTQLEQLEQLASLRDKGVLTADEFNTAKQRILGVE